MAISYRLSGSFKYICIVFFCIQIIIIAYYSQGEGKHVFQANYPFVCDQTSCLIQLSFERLYIMYYEIRLER